MHACCLILTTSLGLATVMPMAEVTRAAAILECRGASSTPPAHTGSKVVSQCLLGVNKMAHLQRSFIKRA